VEALFSFSCLVLMIMVYVGFIRLICRIQIFKLLTHFL
jgi:hypothetical protein